MIITGGFYLYVLNINIQKCEIATTGDVDSITTRIVNFPNDYLFKTSSTQSAYVTHIQLLIQE